MYTIEHMIENVGGDVNNIFVMYSIGPTLI